MNSTTNDQELSKISESDFIESNTSLYTNESMILSNPAPSVILNAP